MRLNQWIIKCKHGDLFEIHNKDTRELEKELNRRSTAWVRQKKRIYAILSDKNIDKFKASKINTRDREAILDSKKEIIMRQILHQVFLTYSFAKIGRIGYYNPNEIIKRSSDFEIHYGFKCSLEFKGDEILLIVSPQQIITPIGGKYDPNFARSNHSRLLSNRTFDFKYQIRCQFLRQFDVLFGSEKSHELPCKSVIQFELDSNDLNVQFLSEPEVDFGSNKFHTWPSVGLKKYHPLDYNLSLDRPEEIKVALIGTTGCFDMLKIVRSGEPEHGQYRFPGFTAIYKSKLVMGKERFSELSVQDIESVKSVTDIVNLLIKKIYLVRNQNVEFDICLIELVDAWASFFGFQEIDLHDTIKVEFSKMGIKTQIITRNLIQSNQGSSYDHFSLGVYFKAGGNPWRLRVMVNNTAFIGISFGFSSTENKRLIGLAEIFDSHGQYVSLRTIAVKEIPKNDSFRPRDLHLKHKQLELLISALLEDYQKSLDNNLPENLVIHKTTSFNKDERKVLSSFQDYPINKSLVYIQSDHHFHIVTEDEKEPGRGLFWIRNENEGLIYSSGSVNDKYFLRGAPLPLLIKVEHSDNFTIRQIAEQLMGLTKLNFNSTNTYSKEPVTLRSSRKIVDLLRAGLNENNIPVDPRFYL